MTTHTQHTPGPWKLIDSDDGGFWITCENGPDIIHAGQLEYGEPGTREEANARLIAQAPAMLEALREALFYVTFTNTTAYNQERQEATYQKCKAILAQIEGKEVQP